MLANWKPLLGWELRQSHSVRPACLYQFDTAWPRRVHTTAARVGNQHMVSVQRKHNSVKGWGQRTLYATFAAALFLDFCFLLKRFFIHMSRVSAVSCRS